MKTLASLCLLLAFSLDARAYLHESSSLEFLADTSHAIGIYDVASLSSKEESYAFLYDIGMDLKESVKGAPPQTAKITSYMIAKDWIGKAGKPVAQGHRFLVFFHTGDSGALEVVHAIDLTQPATPMDDERALPINAKLKPLTNGDDILRTVRERLKLHPATDPLPDGATRYDHTVSIESIPGVGMIGDGYLLYVPDDLLPPLRAAEEVRHIADALRAYFTANHAMPAGDAAQIATTLRGDDAGKVQYLNRNIPRNPAGEILDPWGTPYRIDASNPKSPRAWSCGPDKKDDHGAPGSDDVVSW